LLVVSTEAYELLAFMNNKSSFNRNYNTVGLCSVSWVFTFLWYVPLKPHCMCVAIPVYDLKSS